LASAGQFDGQGDHHTPKLCSSLNAHVHFHVRVVDGVFEEVAGIVFHPASAIDETAVAQVQTDLRRRILRAFVGRGRC
jgi:hypothetical protein